MRVTLTARQIVVLFAVVIGGIYLGLVTPTEAGAIGAFVALLMLLCSREGRGNIRIGLLESFRSTTTTTVMILFTMIGAGIFSYFLTLIQIPQIPAQAITESGIPHTVVAVLLLLYIPMGMFLDAFSMMVITLPIMFPTVIGLGFDPIWFGILCVKMCEIGLITPCRPELLCHRWDRPADASVGRVSWIDAFRTDGVFTVVLIFLFPVIVTWLPDSMMGK